jgi:hypothetical protein
LASLKGSDVKDGNIFEYIELAFGNVFWVIELIYVLMFILANEGNAISVVMSELVWIKSEKMIVVIFSVVNKWNNF